MATQIFIVVFTRTSDWLLHRASRIHSIPRIHTLFVYDPIEYFFPISQYNYNQSPVDDSSAQLPKRRVYQIYLR
jgi:hypothetical protein